MDSENPSETTKQYGMSKVPYPEPFITIPKHEVKNRIGNLSKDQIKQFYDEVFALCV